MKLIPLHPKTRRDGSLSAPIEENAMVDDEDYDRLIPHKWYFKEDNIYSGRYHISVGRDPMPSEREHSNYEKDSLVMMSHHVLRISIKGFRVYHKDGDPRNCQKENLEIPKMDGISFMEVRQNWLDELKPKAQLEMEFPE